MRGTRPGAALAVAVVLGGSAAVARAAEEITAGPPNRYTTPSPTIDQGETVTFRNGDVAAHDVTARDAGPDRKPLFASDLHDGGDSGPVRGTEHLTTGSYAFFCSVHPGMEGTLTVTAAGTPVPRPSTDPPPPAAPPGPAPPDASLRPTTRAAEIRRAGAMRVRVRTSASARLVLQLSIAGRRAGRLTRTFPAGETTARVRIAKAALRRVRAGARYRLVVSGDAAATRAGKLR